MNMHSNKLVVAIKTAGKVLREQKDQVYLPFGSEYSIFIKNLNSVRALIKIELDGQSVTDGEELVVNGNSSLDLQRFFKKGNFNQGNKFKFIERNSKVEAHRGVGVEDGLVRVEFQFEKVVPKPVVVTTVHETIHKHYYDPWNKPLTPIYPWTPAPWNKPFLRCQTDDFYGNVGNTVNVGVTNCSLRTASATNTASAATTANFVETQVVNDTGITVEGSISNQQFQQAGWFDVEDEKHVIVLKLLGQVKEQVVKAPILVRHQQVCKTCGTRNRGKLALFCRECGTSLSIVGESI